MAPDVAPSTQTPPSRPSRPRTLRVGSIPLSVTEEEFRAYLERLLGYDDFLLSFVRFKDYTVATLTLTQGEPAALSKCSPGNRAYLPYLGKLVGLVVDCDFFGITPLYSAQKPLVEYCLPSTCALILSG